MLRRALPVGRAAVALALAGAPLLAGRTAAAQDEPPPLPPPGSAPAPPRPPGAAAVAVDLGPPPPPAPPRGDDNISMIGVRGSMTHVDDTAPSLTVAGRSTEYNDSDAFSLRGTGFWGLGGGSAGFDGALGGSVAIGGRFPFTQWSGPVVRAGLEGYLLGNDLIFASLFELPQVQAGWQYMRGRTVLEIGAKGGAVLTGRLRDPELEGRRVLGTAFEWGGYGSFHLKPMRLDATFTRIEAREEAPGGAVDVLDVSACGIAAYFTACLDARWQRGLVLLPGDVPHGMEALQAGVLLGVVSRLDRRRRPCVTGCP
ncbi:MAG: hypothetical protein WKG00_14620 [Polyangiaceae bacterium]